MDLGVRPGILTNIYQLHDLGEDILELGARLFVFAKLEEYDLLWQCKY